MFLLGVCLSWPKKLLKCSTICFQRLGKLLVQLYSLLPNKLKSNFKNHNLSYIQRIFFSFIISLFESIKKYKVNQKILIKDEKITEVDLNKMTQVAQKRDVSILRNKIKFVSKIAKMQKTLREESEKIIKIKVKFK